MRTESYKTVLRYSLSSPRRSNLETHRIVNQEYVSTPQPNSIGREAGQHEERRNKDVIMLTRTEKVINQMKAELSNVETSSYKQNENNKNRALSIFNTDMINTPMYSGRYIDTYV